MACQEIIWIKTEDDSSQEWNAVLDIIKKEAPDAEAKLDSDLIIKEGEEDSLSVEEILDSPDSPGLPERKEDDLKVAELTGHPIYQHYDVLNKEDKKNRAAVCHYCSQVLKQPFSTTTTLINHLASKHGREYQVYLKFKEQYDAAKSLKCSRAEKYHLAGSLQGKRKWDFDHPSSKSLSHKLTKFIVKGFHDPSIVDEPDFKEFVGEAHPFFEMPDQKTLFKQLVPDMYEKCHRDVLNTIAEDKKTLEAISFTMCSWSSQTGQDHYLGLFTHYVDNQFNMKNISLGHHKLPGPHSKAHINSTLKSKFSEYDLLPFTVPIYVVMDSSPLMTAAMYSLPRVYENLEGRLCFADSVQLVITDVKKTTFGLENLCDNARDIVKFIQHNPDAKEALSRAQSQLKLPEWEVLYGSASNWISEYSMLSRLLKIRVPLTMAMSDTIKNVRSLKYSEWETLKSYVLILKPLFEATVEITSAITPTSSLVYFIIWSSKKSLDKYLSSPSSSKADRDCCEILAKQLLRSLSSKFRYLKTDSVSVLAMILDPRFKVSLLGQEERKKWLKLLKLETSQQPRLETSKEDVSSDSRLSPVSSTEDDDSLWSYMEEVAESNNASLSQSALPIEVELDDYLSQKVLPRNAEPLKFWKENCLRFPILSRLARKYFSIPAVQVASERNNSAAAKVITERRGSLLPEHVEQLVFLQENL